MSKILKGITYSYNRNIGWQDRTIRAIFGIVPAVVAMYFYLIQFHTRSNFCGDFPGADGYRILSQMYNLLFHAYVYDHKS